MSSGYGLSPYGTGPYGDPSDPGPVPIVASSLQLVDFDVTANINTTQALLQIADMDLATTSGGAGNGPGLSGTVRVGGVDVTTVRAGVRVTMTLTVSGTYTSIVRSVSPSDLQLAGSDTSVTFTAPMSPDLQDVVVTFIAVGPTGSSAPLALAVTVLPTVKWYLDFDGTWQPFNPPAVSAPVGGGTGSTGGGGTGGGGTGGGTGTGGGGGTTSPPTTVDLGFESGLTGWVPGVNTNLTRITTPVQAGSGALQLTSAAAGDISAYTDVVVNAGLSYQWSAYVATSGTARNSDVSITWLNTSGTALSTVTSSSDPSSTTFSVRTVSGVAPVGAVTARRTVSIRGVGSGAVHYADTAVWGVYSPPVTPILPLAPTSVTATVVSSSSIAVTWPSATVPAGGGPVTGYKAWSSSGTLLATLGNVTAYTATGLAAGTAYSFQVSAFNADGEGPKRASNTVTTTASGGGGGAGSTVTHGRDITTSNTGHIAYTDPTLGRAVTDGDLTVHTNLVSVSDFVTTGGTITRHWFQGGLVIDKNNVTLRACKFDQGVSGYTNGTHYTFTLDYCTIASPGAAGDDGIHFQNYTANRCNIGGNSDGAKINGNVTITECYIRCKSQDAADHNDGVQNVGGNGPVTILRSNIDCRPTNGSGGPNAALFSADGATGLMTWNDNLVAGGGYTIRMYENATYVCQGNDVVQGSYLYGPTDVQVIPLSNITWGTVRANRLVTSSGGFVSNISLGGGTTPSGPTPTLTARVTGIGGRVSTLTSNATSVRLKVGTDTGVTANVAYSAAVTPDSQGWVTTPVVSGLTAGATYYYRVGMTNSSGSEFFDTAASVGKFRVPPTGATSFAFNMASCCNAADSASMAAIAARGDDLFLHTGDMWYDDGSGTGLANYQSHMKAKLTAPNHASVFARTTSTFSPSDHDFAMNNNGNAGTTTAGRDSYNSVYRQMLPNVPVPSGTGIYHTFTWGRVRFIVLDHRSFASAPSATDNSSKSMLGSTQKAWLKSTITAATEKVIFLVGDTPWVGSASAGDDGWLGFTTERAELGTFFSGSGKNIAYIGGDMHAVAASSSAPVGGIAVFQAAPLNNSASQKGGPYTVGPYPSGGGTVQQYGRIVVTDNGTTVVVAFTGYSSDNTSRVTLSKTYT